MGISINTSHLLIKDYNIGFCWEMTRSARRLRRLSSQLRSGSRDLPSYHWIRGKEDKPKKQTKPIKNDWEDATCSVCMDYPHNAVLLLCSSHDKGCRPYMCGTSYRHSNCLDLFKKAYMSMDNMDNSGTSNSALSDKLAAELTCPLCRGQVKGWTVVEPAREFLNMKKRSCMQDGCSFTGTYKELRKHVRAAHPSAKPRQADPVLEEKWRMLEHEREREDVISTIRSSMPGALVLGDYVIESGGAGSEEELMIEGEVGEGRGVLSNRNWFQFLMLLQAMGNHGSANFASRLRRSQRSYRALLDSDDADLGRAPELPSSLPDLPLAYSDDGNDEHMEEDIDGDDDTLPIATRIERADRVRRSMRHRRRRRTHGSGHGV